MKLNTGDTVMIYLIRRNGALEEVFTNKTQAEAYMRSARKNGEFWRIQEKRSVPHDNAAC